jgi:hypothetical protein
MNDQPKVYTAQCGKCGVLEVEPEAENCPQCNNPLISPAVAAPVPPTPQTGTASSSPPASPTGEPKPAPLDVVTKPDASTSAAPIGQAEANISAVLFEAGFSAEEAAHMAKAAMHELSDRKEAAAAKDAAQPKGDEAASAG